MTKSIGIAAVLASLLAGCSGADFTVAQPLAISDDVADGSPDSALEETVSDAGPDVSPETSPVPDATPDTAPEAPADASPDTTPMPDTAEPADTAPVDSAPTFSVSDVTADNLAVGNWITFTITGTAMPSSLLARVSNCTSAVPVATSGTDTVRTFRCQPWASGLTTCTVYDVPGHVVFSKDFVFTL